MKALKEYVKGVPFFSLRYMKGVTFCQNVVQKGKGLDLGDSLPV